MAPFCCYLAASPIGSGMLMIGHEVPDRPEISIGSDACQADGLFVLLLFSGAFVDQSADRLHRDVAGC